MNSENFVLFGSHGKKIYERDIQSHEWKKKKNREEEENFLWLTQSH